MTSNISSKKPTNPNEHLQIPKWINEDYFQPILEKDIPDYVRITHLTPVAATPPGENYTSVMVRVVIDIQLKDGSAKQISYILKTMLEANSEGAAIVAGMGLFPKEKQMYQVHIPKFQQLYKEAGLDIKLAPKCLHIEELPERTTLIMEDLKRENFKNINRLQGFDMQHMRHILRKLAELHAASVVYYELNGPYDDMYYTSFFKEENRKLFETLGQSRQQLFKEAMLEWGLDNPQYYVDLQVDPKYYFDEAMKLNQVNADEFNVLNHGDCWSNNIMFNYKDNGEIDQTLFVDLQIAKWGSPAQDLWYLITTSVSLDIKVKEFDHFIQIYHKRLVECLKALNYAKSFPSLKDLHIMMVKYGYWGPMTANGVMVAVLMPSDKDSNIDNLMKFGPEGDEYRRKSFNNPYYARAMSQLLPFFDKKGVLAVSQHN